MSERFTWLEGAVELEAVIDDGMICRFIVDRDGAVASFTVERDTTRFRDDGVEADGHEPGERGFYGPPITATWLKKFAFERALHEAKSQTGWWRLVRGDQMEPTELAELDAIRSLPDTRRRGAPGIDPGYYADVARRYVDIIRCGSTKPIVELAEDLGVKLDTARNHVRRARDLGLLTRTYQGHPGGKLTEKAIELLDGTLLCSGKPTKKEDQ